MEKKFPIILFYPPFHGNEYIVDFQEKSDIFPFFADQCSAISNESVLPTELSLRSVTTLSSCFFTKKTFFVCFVSKPS